MKVLDALRFNPLPLRLLPLFLQDELHALRHRRTLQHVITMVGGKIVFELR
ncbi:MAG: hypothetical protein ABIS06_15450 [Vicinamibacterales bacterium]